MYSINLMELIYHFFLQFKCGYISVLSIESCSQCDTEDLEAASSHSLQVYLK